MRILRKHSLLVAITFAALVCSDAAVPTGPNAGQTVPDFQLVDQNGVVRTRTSILGPKGALLIFYRSADW